MINPLRCFSIIDQQSSINNFYLFTRNGFSSRSSPIVVRGPYEYSDPAHPEDWAPQAPNLAEVYHRLRPEFLQKWLANPKRLLPYTGMPENQIPPKAPLDKANAVKILKQQLEKIDFVKLQDGTAV